ncbi:unnamed protein product, partial [Staurois parvus]
MLTPSYPVPLVQCQCFLLALITVWCHWGCQLHQNSSPQCQKNAHRST